MKASAPGFNPLDGDFLLLAFNHIVRKHGVEIWYGGRKYNSMGREPLIVNLQI